MFARVLFVLLLAPAMGLAPQSQAKVGAKTTSRRDLMGAFSAAAAGALIAAPSAASAATTLYIPKLTYSKGKDAWGLFDFKTIVEPPAYLNDENQKKLRAEFDAEYAKNEAEAKAAGYPSLEAKAVGVAKAKALEKEKADAAAAAAKK